MYPNPISYFNPRGRKKFYINFIELVSWAYSITERTQESHPYHDAYSKVSTVFSAAQALFNGTKTYTDPQTLHNQTPTIRNYPAIIPSTSTTFLINYYLENYDARLLEQPIEVGKFNPSFDIQREMDYDDAMYAALDKICRMVEKFTILNSEKYLRRLQILNLVYNPIDNYDGHEVEDLGYEGKETLDREVKASQLSGVKITGPSTNAAITWGSGENTGSLAGGFTNDYKKTSAVAQVGDTVNGEKAGDATVNETTGETTASTTTAGGTDVKSSHYTTTYDDDTDGRLQSYDTSVGTVATSQKGTSSEDVPTMIEAYSGAPNSPSYKDTKNYEERKDKRNLTKWGNMGTMTTQNMIEQEIEMLKEGWNVVEDFMEELNQHIFLSVYDF